MITVIAAGVALAGAGGGVCWLVAGGGVTRGTARGMDIVAAMSATAMRRRGLHTRPGLRIVSPWLRPWKFTPAGEVGIYLGRALWRRLYASVESMVLVVAPPRSFKSLFLAGVVRRAPGPCLTTSTRADLYLGSAAYRNPDTTWVLNHEGVGGVPSTMRVDLTQGCDDVQTAVQRASLMVGATSGPAKDSKYWLDQAADVLRCLLMAAALCGGDMADVWRWSRSLTDREPVTILETNDRAAAGWAGTLAQAAGLDTRPRNSIESTLAQALSFMKDPLLAAAVRPAPGEVAFDPERFLAENGTVHLIAEKHHHDLIAPLFSALTGMIYQTAKAVGAASPAGRLDPPCSLVLDEAPSVCPVPIPQWSRSAGGSGIPLIVSTQGASDLYDTWGEHGAHTIRNNAEVTMVGGGLQDDKYLRELSELTGERYERDAQHGYERRPVFTPAEIKGLRPRRALVLHRSTRPVVATVPIARKRRDPDETPSKEHTR